MYAGKKADGTDGVFAPMMKHLLESMLDGEPENHLEAEKASDVSNRHNSKKTIKSLSSGSFELETDRDRAGSCEPKIVPKRLFSVRMESPVQFGTAENRVSA